MLQALHAGQVPLQLEATQDKSPCRNASVSYLLSAAPLCVGVHGEGKSVRFFCTYVILTSICHISFCIPIHTYANEHASDSEGGIQACACTDERHAKIEGR